MGQAQYVIQNESGWIWDKVNTKTGVSKGLFQFIPSTWNENCNEFGPYLALNPYDQIDCATKMWKKNQETQWETWCNKWGLDLTACDWANKK